MANQLSTDSPQLNIEPQAWRAWLSDPVTQEVFRALRAERADWSTRLETGLTLSPGYEISATAKAVGSIYGLDYLLVGLEEMLRSQWDQVRVARQEQAEQYNSQRKGEPADDWSGSGY